MIDYRMKYSFSKSKMLIEFSNADYTDNISNRKSTSSYVFFIVNEAIS